MVDQSTWGKVVNHGFAFVPAYSETASRRFFTTVSAAYGIIVYDGRLLTMNAPGLLMSFYGLNEKGEPALRSKYGTSSLASSCYTGDWRRWRCSHIVFDASAYGTIDAVCLVSRLIKPPAEMKFSLMVTALYSVQFFQQRRGIQ